MTHMGSMETTTALDAKDSLLTYGGHRFLMGPKCYRLPDLEAIMPSNQAVGLTLEVVQ